MIHRNLPYRFLRGQPLKFCFVSLLRFVPQTLLCNLDNVLMLCKLFKDIAACLKRYICESFDTHYKFNSTICSKKSTCSFYPDITIFLVILRQYRYIGSLDITIPRYNHLIPLLPWHIVISGFQCIT